MLISALAETTRARFKVLDQLASVQTAADAFANAQLGLIVVCDEGEVARGVVSKSDLVRHLARAGAVSEPITAVMSRRVVFASPEDDLHTTRQVMMRRNLQNLPLVDALRRPVGTLDIRDALEAILKAEEQQEDQLVNYIAGNGYR